MKYQRKICSFENIYYICNIINAKKEYAYGSKWVAI